MIKVILYTDTPLYGGAEKQMLLWAKHLNPKKFKVSVICGSYKSLDPLCEELQTAKVEIFRIKSATKHSLSNYFELKKIIKKIKPELIHGQIWNPMACKYAILAAHRLKIPLITTEHDPFALKGIKKLLKKILLKGSTKIITVSKANQELMKKLYPKSAPKLATIHNGIDLQKMTMEIADSSALEINKLKTDFFHSPNPTEKIILSVGTLHPRKGYKYLIQAFKEVQQKYPLTKLIIVGEGPDRKNLTNLIKNLKLDKHCLLPGWNDHILKLMLASDLFILPSLKEAFGLVILEAFAAKLAVIATTVGGIPEIVGKNDGVLIKTANSKLLAKAMLKLLNNQSFREKIALAGYNRVKAFQIEKNIQELEAEYQNLLKTYETKNSI